MRKNLGRRIMLRDEATGGTVDLVITFRKVKSPDGRHSTVGSVSRFDAATGFAQVEITDSAKLGRRDIGRYDFFAGCRIVLPRLLAGLERKYWEGDLLTALRRAVQIELSIEENEDEMRDICRAIEIVTAKRKRLEAARKLSRYPVPRDASKVRSFLETISREAVSVNPHPDPFYRGSAFTDPKPAEPTPEIETRPIHPITESQLIGHPVVIIEGDDDAVLPQGDGDGGDA